MKLKLSLTAILSTTAIASSIFFASASIAQPCPLQEHKNSTEQVNQTNWLHTPIAAALTLPGIALATSLYLRGRAYQG